MTSWRRPDLPGRCYSRQNSGDHRLLFAPYPPPPQPALGVRRDLPINVAPVPVSRTLGGWLLHMVGSLVHKSERNRQLAPASLNARRRHHGVPQSGHCSTPPAPARSHPRCHCRPIRSGAKDWRTGGHWPTAARMKSLFFQAQRRSKRQVIRCETWKNSHVANSKVRSVKNVVEGIPQSGQTGRIGVKETASAPGVHQTTDPFELSGS